LDEREVPGGTRSSPTAHSQSSRTSTVTDRDGNTDPTV
jgi:hypothetical protein